ncbi:hypothetical protein KKD49_11240 [Myxococcota bacterium]|nr:hypothetical protein [Myxococcota bacterium]
MLKYFVSIFYSLLLSTPVSANTWFSKGKSFSIKNSQNIYYKKPMRWFTSHGTWGKDGGQGVDIITGKIVDIPWYRNYPNYPGNSSLTEWSELKMVHFNGGTKKGWFFGKAKVNSTTYYLLEMDFNLKKIVHFIPIRGNSLVSVGMDPQENFFLAATRTSPGNNAGRSIVEKILQIDIKNKKVISSINVTVKTRPGQTTSNLVYLPSSDMKFIYIREHDEYNRSTGKGFLKSPETQGFLVDVNSKSYFTIKTPVEVWTASFTPDNRFLFISSYQKGTLSRLNLKSKSIDKTIKTPDRNMLISATSKQSLYVLHLNGLKVYDLNFKLLKYFTKKQILGSDIWAGPYETDSSGSKMIFGLVRNGKKIYQILNLLR